MVLIVGSGFSGIALGRALRVSRFTDFVILGRESGAGGVWRSNTYPGWVCDVPSHLYSFSFAPNPDWSSTYSPQPEIRAYLQRCADEFGLRPHLRTGVDVEAARWDEGDQLWHVTTSLGPWAATRSRKSCQGAHRPVDGRCSDFGRDRATRHAMIGHRCVRRRAESGMALGHQRSPCSVYIGHCRSAERPGVTRLRVGPDPRHLGAPGRCAGATRV